MGELAVRRPQDVGPRVTEEDKGKEGGTRQVDDSSVLSELSSVSCFSQK